MAAPCACKAPARLIETPEICRSTYRSCSTRTVERSIRRSLQAMTSTTTPASASACIGPGTREVVRLPRDRRKRAPHGPARREALNVGLVAVRPPLPDHGPVGGEVRARGDVAGWIDCLGEVNGGNGPPGILPVEGSD